jgi:hypothetical protein
MSGRPNRRKSREEGKSCTVCLGRIGRGSSGIAGRAWLTTVNSLQNTIPTCSTKLKRTNRCSCGARYYLVQIQVSQQKLLFGSNSPTGTLSRSRRHSDDENWFPADLDRHLLTGGRCCLWLPLQSRWTNDRDALLPFLDELAVFFDRQLVYDATAGRSGPVANIRTAIRVTLSS